MNSSNILKAHVVEAAIRRQAVTVVLIVTAFAATVTAIKTNGDWAFFVRMSKAFTNENGLRVFAVHRDIQTGPISLLLFRVLSLGPLDSVLMNSLVFGSLGCLAGALLVSARRAALPPSQVGPLGRLDLEAVACCGMLMFWWSFLKACGHLDDAVVLVVAAAAVALLSRAKRLAPAVMIGLALAVKPWAFFLVPLTLDPETVGLRRWRYPLISVSIGAALWAPFLIADRGTLDGFRPTVRLAPDSVLRLFGFHSSDLPPALRIAQLLLAFAVAAIATTNGRPAAALLGGFGVRLALDPATWSYYTPGIIVAAVAWDLCESRRRIPWATIIASCCLAPPWVVAADHDRVRLRLLLCVAAVSVAVLPRGLFVLRRSPADDPALERDPDAHERAGGAKERAVEAAR